MKRFKIFLVMLLSFAIVFVGSSIAYYNTKSFGFDEDAVFYKRNEDGFVFLDKEVKFKDINNAIDKAGRYLPDKVCVTKPYLVEHFDELYNIMYI